MSLKADLPGYRQAVVEGGSAPISRAYYVYLQNIATTVDALSASSGDVTAPSSPISANANVIGGFSIYTQGALKTGIVRVLLMGDTQTPGNTQYYGSGPTGARGWFSVSDALAASSNVTLTIGADGITTFDLADLADSGTGSALVKLTRDSKGRISGTSAATTTDLTEGANLYFTAARVRATTLDGLSTATGTAVTAADSVLSGIGKLQAQITDNLLPKGYIDGLQMKWVSDTALTVTSGAAYIQGTGKVLRATANIAKTGLSLSASTWYHVYLYSNAGTPDVEISTTAPDAPYNGTARSKTGDSSQRYVGSVLTDGGGAIYMFQQNGDEISYLTNVVAPFRLLSGGTAGVRTNVSLSGVVPETGDYATFNIINNGSTQLFVDVPELGNSGAITRYTALANQRVVTTSAVPSRTLQYFYGAAPSGSGAFIDVLSYRFSR